MIHMRRKSDLVLFSKKAQSSIADKQTLDRSLGHDFIDMYPIFPTIDMKSEHVYEEHHNYGLATSSAFKNVHTVFLINNEALNSDTDISQLIMYAFGYANAQYELNIEVGFLLCKTSNNNSNQTFLFLFIIRAKS